MAFENISIIGMGYIGLPTAAIFASRKCKVLGVEINPATVETINQGKIHIIEPDLDIAVNSAVSRGYLKASCVVEEADAFLITVPTPFSDGFKPDLSYIESAVKSIAPVVKKGDLIVLESTSPPGTTEKISQWMAEIRSDLVFPHQHSENMDVNIAYCPERVLPGRVLHELIHNDRVVGGMTPECARRAVSLYEIFVQGECFITDSRTAELCKLTENAFRDVNVAFANELSMICDRLDVNVWELIKLANRHPRVEVLQPGPGVGGHCIAVDPWFIVDSAPDESTIIRTAREVNIGKADFTLEKILTTLTSNPDIPVACFGLTFKADIDDLRESPALAIVEKIAEKTQEQVLIVEPYIQELPESLRKYVHLSLVNMDTALKDAGILIMLVKHKDFSEVDSQDRVGKIVVDTCGVWS